MFSPLRISSVPVSAALSSCVLVVLSIIFLFWISPWIFFCLPFVACILDFDSSRSNISMFSVVLQKCALSPFILPTGLVEQRHCLLWLSFIMTILECRVISAENYFKLTTVSSPWQKLDSSVKCDVLPDVRHKIGTQIVEHQHQSELL